MHGMGLGEGGWHRGTALQAFSSGVDGEMESEDHLRKL